jgi:hypothetical protein
MFHNRDSNWVTDEYETVFVSTACNFWFIRKHDTHLMHDSDDKLTMRM